MFVEGVIYKYEGSYGANPHFSNGEDSEYPASFKMLLGSKVQDFVKGIWEPVMGTACVCVQADPLIFQCEAECSILLSPFEALSRDSLTGALKALGVTYIGDGELSVLLDRLDWHLKNLWRDNALTASRVRVVLLDFIKESIVPYSGSWNGAASAKLESLVILNLVFGYKTAHAIKTLIDARIELSMELVDDRPVIYACGKTLDEYIRVNCGVSNWNTAGGVSKALSLINGGSAHER